MIHGYGRTDYCANFTTQDVGKKVRLMGWINKRRDFGSLVFVDLRDRSGIMQVVFDSSKMEGSFDEVDQLRNEYVIAVEGEIVLRDEETVNEKLKTGLIEVSVRNLEIFSRAMTPPFYIEDDVKVGESLKLKYRYLDLRRPEMQKNLIMRHKLATTARQYLDKNGFLEIETPMLIKSTPEGARDYVVPSRLHPGEFYALPQSPQQYKQLLMVSGLDRYYQITKCFRDEDLRADRQPEFTQIDMELSFVGVDDVIAINEGLIKQVFKDILDIDVQLPLPRLTYQEAMDRFGSDKPDTRFGLELKDLSDLLQDCEFKVFAGALKNGGSVRAINAKGCEPKFARREIDSLVDYVKIYRAKGLAWISVTEEGLKSPITKFLKQEEIDAIMDRMDARPGDILFFMADCNKVVYDSLGNLRLEIARRLNMIDENKYNLLWVVDFPLLEYDEDEKRYVAKHHPFTSPKDEDLSMLETSPEKVRAKAYDIVLNGTEIGGGSIRIHDSQVQRKMFAALGLTEEDMETKFGFLIEAFKYGAPPHGGMAYGLDRLAMILAGRDSIRDVIAFPKVQSGACLMSEAPSPISQEQLDELYIQTVEKEEETSEE